MGRDFLTKLIIPLRGPTVPATQAIAPVTTPIEIHIVVLYNLIGVRGILSLDQN
jgi:hypothetical protein